MLSKLPWDFRGDFMAGVLVIGALFIGLQTVLCILQEDLPEREENDGSFTTGETRQQVVCNVALSIR